MGILPIVFGMALFRRKRLGLGEQGGSNLLPLF